MTAHTPAPVLLLPFLDEMSKHANWCRKNVSDAANCTCPAEAAALEAAQIRKQFAGHNSHDALVAALEAQETADTLDDEYQELEERAIEEGWAKDPTGASQLQSAAVTASNAMNLAVQLRRAALKAAKGE